MEMMEITWMERTINVKEELIDQSISDVMRVSEMLSREQ